MNKQELLDKIAMLLQEAKIDEANAKENIDRMLFIGKQNGLLWAQYFIIQAEEK